MVDLGFVGTTLLRTQKFTHLYNSKNIETIAGEEFDLLVFAGMPAAKWLINQNPEPDLQLVAFFKKLLSQVKVKQFVLISTIDVYGKVDHNGQTNEDSVPNPDNPYGLHRYLLEKEIRELFPLAVILRLPGLFGKGLKKNVIYDFIHNNRTSFVLTNSAFQWYDMSELASHIDQAIASGQLLINLFPEPLATEEIYNAAIKSGFKFEEPADKQKPGATYHVQSKYGQVFKSNKPGYLYDKTATYYKIFSYLAHERISKSLGVSSIGWNGKDAAENELILAFLKDQGIRNIEIAPTSIWGPWDEVKKAVADGRVRKFALDLKEQGFTITSMQAILYQLPDIQLHTTADTFISHFKMLVDLANELAVEEQNIKIVFGAPKNRNVPQGVAEDVALKHAHQVFQTIGEYAQGKHATLVIEANPPAYGCFFLNTLDTAREFVHRVKNENIKYMIDTGCASLGNEDLVKVTPEFVDCLAHVHLSQPNLAPFPDNDEFVGTLTKLKSALFYGTNWILETRNTQNPLDFQQSVKSLQKNLVDFLMTLA